MITAQWHKNQTPQCTSIYEIITNCATYISLGNAAWVIAIHRPCRSSAVICWLPTMVARVRVWAACGVCGGQSSTGAGFLWVLRFPLPIIIIITRGWHNRPLSGRSVKWTLIPPPTMQIFFLLPFVVLVGCYVQELMKDLRHCRKRLDVYESSSGSNSIGQGSRASSCNSLNTVEGSTVNTNSSKTSAGGPISRSDSSSSQVFCAVSVCTINRTQRGLRFVQ
jgi:hypothetical protein